MDGKTYKIFFLIIPVLILSWALFLFLPGGRFESSEGGEKNPSDIPEISIADESKSAKAQKPLANPPEEVKAIYLSGETAADAGKMDYLIALVKKSGLNAIVVDVKDSFGYLSYDIADSNGIERKIKKKKIEEIDSFIKNLHDERIYVIARVVVFQDPVLAAARPDLAIKSGVSGKLWLDDKKLAWIDPSSRESWDYAVKIAQDASQRGFDEINFDYIRFPSDGRLSEMVFPFYDPKAFSKREAIRDFFSYIRANLKDIKISADLFGLTTVALDDLGIGQRLEDACRTFDYISPMVYPSHYASGFLGYENPAEHPYEVVGYSIRGAAKKMEECGKTEKNNVFGNGAGNAAKIRPWIQAFNMGAIYDIQKIKAQIKASDESGGTGWMLWNPANNYSFLRDF